MARLHREVMRVLIAEIVSGERAAGELLPRVAELAAMLGVSRGVAGECARALEERGLVTTVQRRGTTINAAERWDRFDPDVFIGLLGCAQGGELLRDHLACRRTVEVSAAGLAAARAHEDGLAALEKALHAMEEAVRRPSTMVHEERYCEADTAFHEALVRATGNRALTRLAERLERALLGARCLLPRVSDRSTTELVEHGRILAALYAGDPVAAQKAMACHLRTAERQMCG